MLGDVSVKGGVTKSKILYGPESNKLHLQFNLSPDPAAALIHRGQPVKLEVDTVGGVDYDVVVPASADEPEANIVGISTHEQDSAYKGSIVVAARGYTVILAQATGAFPIGALLAVGDGAELNPAVYDEDSGYCIVHRLSDGDENTQMGWALETAADGDIIQVLVKN